MQDVTASASDAQASVVRLAEVSEELLQATSECARLLAPAESPDDLSPAALIPLQRRLQMIGQISDALRELTLHGQRFRRAEARALYAEGLTMAELATVFGVSRQRVSMLLREQPAAAPAAATPAGPAE
ncbi:MAG: hypothetical protein LBI49_23285 [Nocardiopsaceae bacterium]|jgi:hypothetical protein|nr:hypothetical protein [Nocardiopsaceae bacterium]